MVRKLPIIHKDPPPPPDRIFDLPNSTSGVGSDSSSSKIPLVVTPNNASKLQRRQHIPSSFASNHQKSSQNSIPKANDKQQLEISDEAKFALFNYLQELALTEAEFEESIKKEGLELYKVDGDGNCMFRAVADQIYGDEEMHDQVRLCCMDYMKQEADFFKNYVSVDFDAYIEHKRKLKVFGDHLELQAIAELYNRPIEIRIPGKPTIRICESEENDALNPPLVLSYHNNNHYNSIRNPKKPSVGVGLGLPSSLLSSNGDQKFQSVEGIQIENAVLQSINSDAEKQIMDVIIEESEKEDQNRHIETVVTETVRKESEMEEIESAMMQDSMIDNFVDEQMSFYREMDHGQNFGVEYGDEDYYEDMDEEELMRREMEEAIQLSLLESNNQQNNS